VGGRGLRHRAAPEVLTPTRTRTRAAAQQRRAATEKAILDATEFLLETRPFRDLTVEDVMDVAGLGRTAFYRYFPDLESVVLRHMVGIAHELSLASQHWLTAEDPDAQLVAAGMRIAAVYRDHGRVMQAFSDAAGSWPDVHEAWRATLDSLIEPGVAHLRVLVAQGRAECEHPDETIRALALLIDRYYLDIYGRSAAVDIAEPVAVLAEIWRRALRLR
jgi:TetR/AcrR family transcriptional regulator, ethionamide resistance regulator